MDKVDDLCALIVENLNETHRSGHEEVRPDTPLLVSGLLDSLTILRIVSQVEQRLHISFPETSVVAANFRTPAALWAAIERFRVVEHQDNTP